MLIAIQNCGIIKEIAYLFKENNYMEIIFGRKYYLKFIGRYGYLMAMRREGPSDNERTIFQFNEASGVAHFCSSEALDAQVELSEGTIAEIKNDNITDNKIDNKSATVAGNKSVQTDNSTKNTQDDQKIEVSSNEPTKEEQKEEYKEEPDEEPTQEGFEQMDLSYFFNIEED